MQIGVETAKAVDQRRVFVIDDDEITRAALQFMLHDEIETHELATPEEAYEKGVDWLVPNVVLLGVSFLKQRGPELVREIARLGGDVSGFVHPAVQAALAAKWRRGE